MKSPPIPPHQERLEDPQEPLEDHQEHDQEDNAVVENGENDEKESKKVENQPAETKKRKRNCWSVEDDQRLKSMVLESQTPKWSSIAKSFPNRNGSTCRRRWIEYINPAIDRRRFTEGDEARLLHLHGILGNQWTRLAEHFPGRSSAQVRTQYRQILARQAAAGASSSVTVADSTEADVDGNTTRDVTTEADGNAQVEDGNTSSDVSDEDVNNFYDFITNMRIPRP